MERGYSERMVRMQILKARGESRDSLLERGNTKTSNSKLTFNITYYPAFKTFWQHKLKTFYSRGLNEKEEYFNHTQYVSL